MQKKGNHVKVKKKKISHIRGDCDLASIATATTSNMVSFYLI